MLLHEVVKHCTLGYIFFSPQLFFYISSVPQNKTRAASFKSTGIFLLQCYYKQSGSMLSPYRFKREIISETFLYSKDVWKLKDF